MAQLVPDICPREAEFVDVLCHVRGELANIVGGTPKSHVTVLFGGSGTAVMDAAINSAVPPGKTIVVVNNGFYGKRLADIARIYQISLREIKIPWDRPADVEQVREAVADPSVGALAFVHHETTTGLLNPLEELVNVGKEAGCMVIVDAISSYAGIHIDVSRTPVDFLLSTSNKCIQGMAGVAFVIAQKESLEQIREFPPRSYYLNVWQQYEKFEETGEMRFTPPVQVIYALKQAMAELRTEGGVPARQERYRKNYQTLKRGLADLGFNFLLAPEYESHILLTVLEPEDQNFNFRVLHDKLKSRGFTIYPGKLSGAKTFRLAVMGDIYNADIKDFLAALEESLGQMGIKTGARVGTAEASV